jgi:hypothetical protein
LKNGNLGEQVDESYKIEKDFRKTDCEGKENRVQFWAFLLSRVPIARGNFRCFASQSRYHVAARELGSCRAKSERFFVPRQRDFSVLCFFQLRRSCGVDQQPHAAAALRC